MIVNKYNSIICVSKLWKELYSNSGLSWFQSYEWNECLEKNFYAKKRTKYCACSLFYISIDDKFIAPIIINKRKKQLTLLGSMESSDYLSFIYDNNLSNEELTTFLSFIINNYKKYTIILDKINETNRLYCILLQLFKKEKIENEVFVSDCVFVSTNTEYEKFFKSLSKSTRQNYRTAVNRLTRDQLDYKVTISYSNVDKEKASKFLKIYNLRRRECDVTTFSDYIKVRIHKIIKTVLGEKNFDPLTFYSTHNNVFLSEIYINGEIAAFCEGDYNNNAKQISISRVATYSSYYKYSPGIIMLIDTIEKIKANVLIFDLTRGTEEYKFKLGGQTHHNYKFIIRRKKCLKL